MVHAYTGNLYSGETNDLQLHIWTRSTHISTWRNFRNTVKHNEQIEKTIISMVSLHEVQNQAPLDDDMVVKDPLRMD